MDIDYVSSYKIHQRVTEVIAASDTGDEIATAQAIYALRDYPGAYVFEALAETVIDALHAPSDTPVQDWAARRIAKLTLREIELKKTAADVAAEIDEMTGENDND